MAFCKSFHQFTSLSSAIDLDDDGENDFLDDGVVGVLVTAELQNVRWRDDGTAPTAAIGHILEAGKSMYYDFSKLANLKFIEETASAKLNVSYYV